MNRTVTAFVGVALLATAATSFAPGTGRAAPSKEPDTQTALPPSQSPPLSAGQRAKLDAARQAAMAAPATQPKPTGKGAPLTTTGPAHAGVARDPSLAGKATGLSPGLLQRDLATAMGRPVVMPAGTPARQKDPDVTRSAPLDPKQQAAHAAAQAEKQAHARPAAGPAGHKPPAFETRGPAPATLSPEQMAKRAQAANGNAGGGR